MPPVRKPRPARPQTSRCRYVPARGPRCTKLATVAGELCRQHAIELSQQLGAIPPPRGRAPTLLEVIEGAIEHSRGAFTGVLEDAIYRGIDSLMGGVSRGGPPLPRSASPPRSPPRDQRPPPPPSKKAELVRARGVLGFEVSEQLTEAIVKERKQALARIFHPDRHPDKKIGHEKTVRINAAAELLLANLSLANTA